MWIFTFIIAFVILPAFIYKNVFKNTEIILKIERLHITICFILLFFVSAFRGDFSTDYKSYYNMFQSFNTLTFAEIFSINFYLNVIESGYAMLNVIINYFTNNAIWLFVVSSVTILLPIYKSILLESNIKWLSILLFLIIGNYFDSFNIMRQIMAASIVFAGSNYLYKRNYHKYVIFVLIASLFHVTAIFMSIFYFLLILKPRKISGVIYFIFGLLLFVFMEEITRLIDLYLFNGYYYSSYSGIGMSSISLYNAIVPFAVGMFTLIFRKYLNQDSIKHRVWFNGTLLWVLFELLSIKLFLITRISTFFSPFMYLLVPAIISNLKDTRLKIASIIQIVGLLLLYFYYILGEKVSSYYFFFN